MGARDPHRFSTELDKTSIARLIERLENRAKDKIFTNLFEKYIARLNLPTGARVLEIGCGTGAMMRRLARHENFSGEAIGVDQCPPFIEAAIHFAHEENLDQKVQFQIGDAHDIKFQEHSFDAVIANTLISHASDPAKVLHEMARVVRPGGTVAIFDGDYASLTFAFADHAFGQKMDEAMSSATFNNPRIMRDLPRLLPETGLKLKEAWGDAVVEIGAGSYFKSFAETYVPYVIKAGTLPEDKVAAWLTTQKQSMQQGTFFASCIYYTYLAQPS